MIDDSGGRPKAGVHRTSPSVLFLQARPRASSATPNALLIASCSRRRSSPRPALRADAALRPARRTQAALDRRARRYRRHHRVAADRAAGRCGRRRLRDHRRRPAPHGRHEPRPGAAPGRPPSRRRRCRARSTRITARGFAISTANKMLVLIDGRTRLLAGLRRRVLGSAGRRHPGHRAHRGHARSWRQRLGRQRRQRRHQRHHQARRRYQGHVRRPVGRHRACSGPYAVRHGGRLGAAGVVSRLCEGALRRRASTGERRRRQGRFRLRPGGLPARVRSSPAASQFVLQGDIYTGTTGLSTAAEANLSGGNLLGRWTQRRRRPRSPASRPTTITPIAACPASIAASLNTFDLDAQHHWTRRPAQPGLRRRLPPLRRRRSRRRPGLLLRSARAHLASPQRVRAGRDRTSRAACSSRSARSSSATNSPASRFSRPSAPAGAARAAASGARCRARCACRRGSTPICASASRTRRRLLLTGIGRVRVRERDRLRSRLPPAVPRSLLHRRRRPTSTATTTCARRSSRPGQPIVLANMMNARDPRRRDHRLRAS